MASQEMEVAAVIQLGLALRVSSVMQQHGNNSVHYLQVILFTCPSNAHGRVSPAGTCSVSDFVYVSCCYVCLFVGQCDASWSGPNCLSCATNYYVSCSQLSIASSSPYV